MVSSTARPAASSRSQGRSWRVWGKFCLRPPTTWRQAIGPADGRRGKGRFVRRIRRITLKETKVLPHGHRAFDRRWTPINADGGNFSATKGRIERRGDDQCPSFLALGWLG